MKRAALYIRVSTEQQAKNGDSLREQHDTLLEFVKNNSDVVIVDEYIDDGISGQKIKRDEFQRLIDDVKNNKIDIILFTKLDRWFRNLRHYLNIQEVLEKNNVCWNAVSQQYYDTSTAYGRTFIAQVMSFAELEAQMASERIKSVFHNKIQKGEVVSGKVPLGYSISNKKLVLNDQAEIVKDIFNYFIECSSLRKTVRYMENLGIVRDYQSVKNMLTNKKYIGELRDNKNFCPAIIDEKTFNTAQKMLSKNVKVSAKRTYIFTGLLICTECGRRFSSSCLNYTHTRKDGSVSKKTKKLYRCIVNRNYAHRCSNKKSFYETALENYLLENIQKEVQQFIFDSSNTRKQASTRDNEKKSIEKKLDRLKTAYLNEVIDLNEYRKDKEKLTVILKEMEQRRVEVKDISVLQKVLDENFIKLYKEMLDEDKRYFWRSIIDRLELFPNGSIKIFFL